MQWCCCIVHERHKPSPDSFNVTVHMCTPSYIINTIKRAADVTEINTADKSPNRETAKEGHSQTVIKSVCTHAHHCFRSLRRRNYAACQPDLCIPCASVEAHCVGGEQTQGRTAVTERRWKIKDSGSTHK